MSIRYQLFLLGLVLSISKCTAEGMCKQCDSTDDKCTNDPDSIELTACADQSAMQCFTLVENNGKVKRGCVDSTNNKCDTKNCLPCNIEEKNCNGKKDIFTCKNCDSSTDPKCSKWSDANAITNEICGNGITKCLMQIKEDKNIERRCAATTTEACATDKKCEICDKSGCNKDIYPKDRTQCYQCSESDPKCANPSANGISSAPCTLYDKDDQCYMYGTSETAMNRGCTSDTATFSKCKDVASKCSQCKADNCNNSGYKKQQSITCIQCAESDNLCAWGHADTDSKNCPNAIEYWETEGCYTNKVGENKTARGCLHDAPTTLDCTAGSSTCKTCNTSACNKLDTMNFTCYKCRSDDNPSCAKKLEGEKYKYESCRNPVQPDTKGCYTERWNDIIIRSCLVDADSKTLANCKDTKYKKCSICEESNCNKEDPPNSSPQSLALASGILAFALLLSRFL